MKFRSFGIGLMAALVALCCLAFSSVPAQEINSPIGAKHVIFIGFDGYGGHYVDWDELPNLSRFHDNGAWTLKKRSVLGPGSAINWASILMGAPSEIHGYREWDSREPDIPSADLTENGRFPDIFYLIRKQIPDAKLYCVYSWDGIGYLFDKTAITDEYPAGNEEEVCETGLEYLAENPTFAFIYFSQPDGAGHTTGWGSPEYHKMVRDLDYLVGQLFDYLEENDRLKDTVVLLSSDHGGIGRYHDDEVPEVLEAPLLFYGCGVKPGEITDVVAGYDIGATIAWILGVTPPQSWRGKPITSAFGK